MLTLSSQDFQSSNQQSKDIFSQRHSNEQLLQIKNETSDNDIHKKQRIIKKQKAMQKKILGGGCGTSQIQIQKIESKQKKPQKFNKKFLENHLFYTDKKEIYENIEAGCYGPMQLEIFQNLFSFDASIRIDIYLYKPKLIELIDVYLIYLLAGSSEKEILKQSEIDNLCSQIKELKKSFDMESNEQPCLDLSFYFDILDQFNSNRVGKDTQNKSTLDKVTVLVSNIVKLGASIGSAISGDIVSAIKLGLQGTLLLLETYKKSKANQLFSFLLDIWRRKTTQFEDKIWQLTLEQELDFYLNLLYEFCSKNEQDNELILLTLIKIDYFFGIAQEEEKNRQMVIQKFPLNSQLISKILPFLMQKGDSQQFLEFLSFSVQNPTYRFLAISVLLKYYQIISIVNDFPDQKEYILIYLSYKYLCEKKKPVKLAYETNKQFVEIFNNKIEDAQFKEKILETSKRRRQQNIPMLENSEDKIENNEDILRMVANILIDQWEINVKRRQKENIAQKDDILLEVKDLYIQQSLTFLKGSLIFEEKLQTKQLNALQIMTDIFLSDDCSQQNLQSEQKKNNNEQSNCKIFGILAEGGTGKSMLIKKLESYLIEHSNSKVFSSENKDFIPLLIKCNSLDPINPSIESYLKQQGIEQKQIDSLKNSIRYKVILLDGYDEYTGEYFRIYSKLNLNSWKNTKIIVTSRREKLELSEACFNFSIDNENGQLDNSSFIILKLEEFKEKDIIDYCERFFKQKRTIKDQQFDEAQYQKDLIVIKDCMRDNKQLENLLYLPINLYLFTRMIVEIKEESEIQAIKTSIIDQISIQEVFFKEQFKREAQDFMHISIDSEKRNLNIQDEIINTYFEYFQAAAMKMFLNKGKKEVVNFLQIQKDKIEFSLRNDFAKKFSQKQQTTLLDKIVNYVNSKIITRVKEESNIDQKSLKKNSCQVVEFKHKSLFEYFVARAMQYDFDIQGNEIYNLPMEKLKQFSINQKTIMNIGQNQSEQQILLKLYRLIKDQIETEQFYSSYSDQNISKNNKFIQYLKRSSIQKYTDVSQIDTGASNLISAIFFSKFPFSKLSLSLCSFSKAYICNPKSNEISFDKCNFQFAYLKNTLINYDSCNTMSACFDSFSKIFDTKNIYNFNKILWGKNDLLYTISESGFVNSFKVQGKDTKLHESKQLSQTSLSQIRFMSDDTLIISSKFSLILINSNNFEIKGTQIFKDPILDFLLIKENIIVTLINKTLFFGTFEKGFKQMAQNGQGSEFNSIKEKLRAHQYNLRSYSKNIFCCIFCKWKISGTGSEDKICKIWNVDKDSELINTIKGHTRSISSVVFSTDGKYLVTGSKDQTCKIWNAEKGYELVNTIEGHIESISSIAFSIDSKYLATVSEDQTFKLWNTEKNFELINTISSHTQQISSVAFSADGKYLATGSWDQTFKIWNAEKGFKLINTIEGHTGVITSIAFSEDGQYFATGSVDKTCKIWNVKKGFELINTIQGHTGGIQSVAFSADGKYLLTGSSDKSCKLWNPQKGFELINTTQGHTKCIYTVAISTDGKYLATGSGDQTCKIWNAEKGFELIKTISGHTQAISSVDFSADGKYLATVSEDKTCKIWNTEKSFELINTIQGHTDQIYAVAFSADGKYLVTGSQDQTCKIWNAEKGFDLINTIQGHTLEITSVAFSADGKYLSTGSKDQTYKIWSVEKGFELINSIQSHTQIIYAIAFSANGKYIATGSSDQTCKIWNVKKGFELINTIQGHTRDISSVAFSTNGKYLATGSWDETCKIWNAEKGFVLINTIQGHNRAISSVAFSADGKYLSTGSFDQTFKIWNVNQGFELINSTIQGDEPISSVAFSTNGKYLATGSWDLNCKIWNLEKGYELLYKIEGHTLEITSVVFSVDGKYLVTGSNDKTFKIWNAEKGFELINTIQGHTQEISSVAFSADGKYLITGSYDQTCKIWNAEQNFELNNTIYGHTREISSVTFSADGKYLATGSFDQTCKIWNIQLKNFELFQNIYCL